MTAPRSYTVVLSAAAQRAIEQDLPEAVAAAVVDFLVGPLAADPHRVGKPLRLGLEGLRSARRGRYRVTAPTPTGHDAPTSDLGVGAGLLSVAWVCTGAWVSGRRPGGWQTPAA